MSSDLAGIAKSARVDRITTEARRRGAIALRG